ncbi:cytochrome P450 [Aspergillus crustosus]
MAIFDFVTQGHELVYVIAGSILAVFVLQLAYATITDPLRSIPGPFLSRWTDLHVKFVWLAGGRPQYVHSLHQKYGPIVRVTPDEVDISDISTAREIHRVGSKFRKSQFYRKLGPIENLFTTTDPKFHANRRRLLAPFFAESSISKLEPIVLDKVRLTVQKIRDEMKTQGHADVFKWWTLMAMDTIGELSFGESFGLVEAGKKNQYATDIASAAHFHPIRTTFPTLIRMAAYLPLPMFTEVGQAVQRIGAYARTLISRYKQLLALDPDNPKKMLFTDLLKAEKQEISEMELTFESQSYITAGTDTTAVTLTYIVYAVSRDSSIRDRLLAELQTVPDNLVHEDVKNLPYLNQVIDEGLRVYGAAPGALPRVVPAGGASLVGHQLPAGLTVATQAYSLGRDADVFPDPERFIPSRWEHPTKLMKDGFMAFGAGTRSCIGVYLARMELRLALALFFKSFPKAKLSTKAGMLEQELEMKIYFLVSPKGHRCLMEN